MSSISVQRDLVINLKRETLLNVGILSKLVSMSAELNRQIFKENALEKPTQNVFNHLAHYLVTIIDPQVSTSLSWPLYDTKTERTYRNQLSLFISDCGSKGLLTPVMSSYLVNPGCFKVTVLIFQLSQLAVQRILMCKMGKKHQKILYHDMTEKYKSQTAENFIECIEKETTTMLNKFSNYLRKRKAMETIAASFRTRITEMGNTLLELKAVEYLDKLISDFIKQNKHLDNKFTEELIKIKNVNQHTEIFELWLNYVDDYTSVLEQKWNTKASPLLGICKQAQENSEELISRHTGEADKSNYTMEFNPKTDEINTTELQKEVNSQQKYILKNIVKEGRLNFPNLIRGFLVSICFILRGAEIGDEVYKFNEYLEGGSTSYKQVLSAMRTLMERVMNAESRLEKSPVLFNQSISLRESKEIPPMPDLTDLKMGREYHNHLFFDTFTPINSTKYNFNLRKKLHTSFAIPFPKPFTTPFHGGLRDDFRSAFSCQTSAYDRTNMSHSMYNMSMMSQTARGNETIADFTSGFSKQQLCRLLSTKKTSSSKKHKFKTERPLNNVKKGNLFSESISSNESIPIFRSHSSPNLYEDRDKRKSLAKFKSRKLTIMKEDFPSLLEVSGITALERDSNHSTPQNLVLDNCRKLNDSASLPIISITPDTSERLNKVLEASPVDLNMEIRNDSLESQKSQKSHKITWKEDVEVQSINDTRNETPKSNPKVITKTNSLEKIINRFKKVRASVIPSEMKYEDAEFKTIVEEKENVNNINANRILLPDLLSPSFSLITQKSNEFLDEISFSSDEEKPSRKPRESLGTALGVDHTFLDQFDLID